MPSAPAPDIEIRLTSEHDDPRGSSGSGRSSDGDDDIFMTIEQPKPLGREESLQKERQISVDPSSLRGGTVRQASFTLVSPQRPSSGIRSPPKLKFLSASLPSSASSSPRSGSSSLLKKIWNNESPRLVSRQHSSFDDADRSIDDFDLPLHAPRPKQQPRARPKGKKDDDDNEGFKCGKLCLFLPRGKGKPVRASSTSSVSPLPLPLPLPRAQRPHPTISRTVSMERFDCNDQGESSREPMNLFFDLPLELIRCSVSDMQSPVTTAFLFEKDEEEKPKGVLKKTTSGAGRTQETRHVRFSTSSPTTYPSSPSGITPRLRKARADFTTFVEAQTT